jgi:putative transposase
MPDYRRAFAPGGTFFFTVVTARRAPILCTRVAIPLLRSSFAETRRRWPFTIDAIVILPDHLHAIWTLPKDDHDFSIRWAFFKKAFTQAWLAASGGEQPTSESNRRHRRRGVWQRKFWEHTIRDEGDFGRHFDYIHFNPVRHELVTCPHKWPHSSFHQWVKKGAYEWHWNCVCGRCRVRGPSFDGIAKTAME